MSLFTDWTARAAALEEVASKMGMTFVKEDEWGLRHRLKDFGLFKEGHSRTIFNLMQRKDAFLEEEFNIFDYKYTISANNYQKTFYQTVFFIKSHHLALPEFVLKPENFFHKIASYFGWQDIDFEESPEFSDSYLLRGKDESYIRQIIKEKVRYFFTLEKKYTLAGVGFYLIFYKQEELLSPAAIEQFYRKGMTVYGMLKEKS
jgi:hypothetical protein